MQPKPVTPDPATDLAPTLTDAELDAAVEHLGKLNRKAFLQYVVETGAYLVKTFFDGDYAAVHDQSGHKQRSFRELLTRRTDELRELNLSGNTLRRYMAAAEVFQSLPHDVRSALNVEVMQRLAAVPEGPDRLKLAQDAAEMKWSREQTTIAVQKLKSGGKDKAKKPGRKPKPEVLKRASAAHRAVRHLVKLAGAASQLEGKHRDAFLADVLAARKLLTGLV